MTSCRPVAPVPNTSTPVASRWKDTVTDFGVVALAGRESSVRWVTGVGTETGAQPARSTTITAERTVRIWRRVYQRSVGQPRIAPAVGYPAAEHDITDRQQLTERAEELSLV